MSITTMIPIDIQTNIIRMACAMELQDTMGDPGDDRAAVVRSIVRLFALHAYDHFDHLCRYMNNDLVTLGFGPGDFYEPFLDDLYHGVDCRTLCTVHTQYDVDHLKRILSTVMDYYPGAHIRLRGWD